VAAMAIAGYALGHRPAVTAPPAFRFRRRQASAGGTATMKVGIAATLFTVLRAALKLGTNPLVRSVWQSYARRRV